MNAMNYEQMKEFIISMADMITPEEEFNDPEQPELRKRYTCADEMMHEMSDDRLIDEYLTFMAMVKDARAIRDGLATADSAHAEPIADQEQPEKFGDYHMSH
ncbi:MAG: hypothetical protein U5K75_02995 [Ahrensia sp.]|nr:hypothetical protein [Ahrensia sp.]